MDILDQILIEELERNNRFINSAKKEISELLIGYISKKKINNITYYYHQWREGEKIKSKYIENEDVEILNKKIERRRSLEKSIKNAEDENKRINKVIK